MAILAKLSDRTPHARRRRRLRSLAVVPSLMTIGNLLCGFAAIHFAVRAMIDSSAVASTVPAAVETLSQSLLERLLPSFLSIGAGLVILGMVFDLLDGLLARVTRSTTNFGGQLDSLADVVTFGVAPAILMITMMTKELVPHAVVPSPISDTFFGRIAWVCGGLYVVFTAVRLARYNVEHAKADFDYRTFRGLPSPGAACVIAAFLLVQDQVGQNAQMVIVYLMPLVAATVAFLMVSRVPYRRFHRAYFLGRKPFSHLITFVLVLAVFWSFKAPTLLLIVLWYAASGPVFYLARILRPPPTASAKAIDNPQRGVDRKQHA